MALQTARDNRGEPHSGHDWRSVGGSSGLPLPLAEFRLVTARCSAVRASERTGRRFSRAMIGQFNLSLSNQHPRCVCNCKRWAEALLLHARCGKRGGFVPPKTARDRYPEIRLAGPLLSRDGFLEGHLSQILRGKRSPSLTTIVRLARALQIEVADFFKTPAKKPTAPGQRS